MRDENLRPDNIFRQTLFGVPIVQQWCDLWLWEQVFEQTPELKGVLELGTLKGGLSLFLRLQTMQRGQRFCTVDWVDFLTPCPLFDLVDMAGQRLEIDMWVGEGRATLNRMLADDAWHPLLLLCDGGNKPKEVQTFTPLLRAGDIVAVHDWGTEFGPADLEPVEHLLEPYLAEYAEWLGGMTRWWRRV